MPLAFAKGQQDCVPATAYCYEYLVRATQISPWLLARALLLIWLRCPVPAQLLDGL